MSFEGNGGESVPERHDIPHYHGDAVRVLFVVSAMVIVVAQSTGADLPLSTFSAIISAVVLVVIAGITNPAQSWIHWLNAFVAVIGVLIFGIAAVERYRSGTNVFDISFIYIETLALLSLVALYLTTRTIRGIFQKSKF